MVEQLNTVMSLQVAHHSILESPLVQMFAGALISVMTTVFLDAQRRPKLIIEIADSHRISTKDPDGKAIEFLEPVAVFVRNVKRRPLIWPRQTLQHASAEISFLDAVTGANLCNRAMPGRWTDSAEPESPSTEKGKRVFSGNQAMFHITPLADIPWGASAKLDVAARFENERAVYGWNNRNFYDSQHRYRNDRFSIHVDRCLVRIVVSGSGERVEEVFALVNVDGDPLRLESPTRIERKLARNLT